MTANILADARIFDGLFGELGDGHVADLIVGDVDPLAAMGCSAGRVRCS